MKARSDCRLLLACDCRAKLQRRFGKYDIFQCPQWKALNAGIAGFYDQSSGVWEDIWGEHMHHGYYPKDGPKKSNQAAQIDMIEEILAWAGVQTVNKARAASHCLSRLVDHGAVPHGLQQDTHI